MRLTADSVRRALVRGALCLLGLAAVAGCALAPAVQPLPQAHAHNDYEHPRPLHDALEHGFCNIEADIFLVDGALLVAHDRKDLRPERTLAALYLEPLRARVRANGGRVFRGGPAAIVLLVDVKTEAVATYAALEAQLAQYADVITSYRQGQPTRRAVDVILSGNRATAEVAAAPLRHVALDGRSTDLDAADPVTLYPWISDNWSKLSRWRGEGPLPAADRARLDDWVRRAHARGRKLRFWNTPETPEAWRVLRAAGVDLIGTDDLARLRDFLRAGTAGQSNG